MKTFSIFYTFSSDKDPTPNFYQIENSFQNLDEFKIKHVLSAFPMPLDQKPYHIRFKTVCEEVEPKMMAWIDISNPNAKVPLINNQVFMKILELPDFGLSKIYTKTKLESFRSSQNKIDQTSSNTSNPPKITQERPQVAQIQTTEKQSPMTTFQHKESPIKVQFKEPPVKQHYQQQQKVLDDLLGGDDDFEDQNQNPYGQFQQSDQNQFGQYEQSDQNKQGHQQQSDQNQYGYHKQPDQNQQVYQQQPGQKIDDSDGFDFASFKPVQDEKIQTQQQFQQQSSVVNSNNSKVKQNIQPDLWEDEGDVVVQTTQGKNAAQQDDEPIDREKIKARNKMLVENIVQGKVDELNKIWDDEDQYKIWRQEAKEQLEPQIIKWAFKDGSRSQIRNMLSLLHEILWEGADWKPCSFTDLLNDGAVKRKYHDAIRVVHPDKNQFRDHRQRYISERVFFELNQSFNLHRVQQQKSASKEQ